MSLANKIALGLILLVGVELGVVFTALAYLAPGH